MLSHGATQIKDQDARGIKDNRWILPHLSQKVATVETEFWIFMHLNLAQFCGFQNLPLTATRIVSCCGAASSFVERHFGQEVWLHEDVQTPLAWTQTCGLGKTCLPGRRLLQVFSCVFVIRCKHCCDSLAVLRGLVTVCVCVCVCHAL